MPIDEKYIVDRVDDTDGCWRWKNFVNPYGYAVISYREGGERTNEMAHRLSYKLFVGDIPEGMVIDHLCRVRDCVNPSHLEVVSQRVNIRRGLTGTGRHKLLSHCSRGHKFTEKNTYIKPNGARNCKSCLKINQIKYKGITV